jgi:hypothetical protein
LLWRAGLVGAFALGACSLVLDFSGEVIDGGPDGDAFAALCLVDEPNDDQETAPTVRSFMVLGAICPAGDRDFYQFTTDGSQDVVVELRFDNRDGAGDLDLVIRNASGTEVPPASRGIGDVERIERTISSPDGRLPAGMYAIEVFAADGQRENSYSLELTLTPDTAVLDAGVASTAL